MDWISVHYKLQGILGLQDITTLIGMELFQNIITFLMATDSLQYGWLQPAYTKDKPTVL